jgi:hypothetical protein
MLAIFGICTGLRLAGVFSDLNSEGFEFVAFTAEVDLWTRNGRNLGKRATGTE